MQFFLSLGIVLIPTFAVSANTTPLRADQAFIFSLHAAEPNQFIAKWQIAPGYYLYRDRIHISSTDARVFMVLPKAELKKEGKYQIYSGGLSVPLLFTNKTSNVLQLNVVYQGCSKKGFCYPPIYKTLSLDTGSRAFARDDGLAKIDKIPPANFSLSGLISDQNGVQSFLQTKHLVSIFLIFGALGLLLAFTPCVLPMIPILGSIIVGHKAEMHSKKAFWLSFSYVMGMAITYACAGVLAALLGSTIQVAVQKPWILTLFSGIFVLLALSLFDFYELRLPKNILQRVTFWSNHQKRGTYLGVFLMGVFSTLIVSPCVTAPLVGVLLYIGNTGNVLFGASALFALGIGMGIPLLLVGLGAGKWLPKKGGWMEAIKKGFGILMLGMAIWLFSRVAPYAFTLFLYGMLLLGAAIFLTVLLPRLIGLPRINRSLGLLVGILGTLVLLSSVGIFDLFGIKQVTVASTIKSSSFVIIHNETQLARELESAKLSRRPVMLDFYADWCDSCVSMDQKVFSSSKVREALSNFVVLRADITNNSARDQALMKQFDVVAPPTMLFFNASGKELTAKRIVGEVSAKEFLSRVNGLKK